MSKRIIYLLFIFLCLNSTISQAQAPEGINYQAVFRKPSGAIVSGQSLACKIEIMQGNISGNLAYAERHSVVTNQQGIANFVIGQGLTTTGVFSDIDWGNGPYYMKLYVDFDGQGNIFQMQQYGAQQLVSVPYALHAKVADSIAGGVGGSGGGTDDQNLTGANLNGTELQIDIEDGTSATVDLAPLQDGVDDADNNPTNELNTGASFNNNILEIQDAGGAVTADLSALDNSGTDDQNLTGANLNGTELQIDIEDGTSATVDLASLQDGTGTDDQNLTGANLNGTELQINIEDGNSATVDLAPLQDGTGTDDQNLTGALNGTELQIDIEGGTSATVDLAPLQDGVEDADNDPTNELNTGAIFNNNILEIQDAGGAVTADLSALDNSGTDDQNASEVFYDNTISGLGGNEVQSAIDQLAIDVSTTGVASIKEFTNSDFLSDCATLGSGTWQTIAVIPGISPFSAEVAERASYARFQVYDYSQITNGGEARELIEFNISRFSNYGRIQLLNHDLSSYNSSASIKIEKIRIQHGKVTIGGGSVWCANIQLYRSNNCNNGNSAETNIFVKMSDQIPLTETPLVIIPMELTSTPLSLTNIMTDELSILNNSGDDVNDADSDPNNEIQDLSISNHILELSGSNQDIDLSPYLQEMYWSRNNSLNQIYPGSLSDKVGINHNNPLHNLDVNGTVATNYLFPRSGDGSNYRYLRFGTDSDYYAGFMWNNTSTSFGDGDDFTIFTYGNRDIYLNPGSGKVQVKGGDFIVDNGSTGLGESDPDSKLEVSGRIHAIHNVAGQAALWIEHNGTSGGNYGIYQNGSGSNNTINYLEGNLGIGTIPNATGEKLQIQGDISVTGKYKDSDGLTGTNGQVLTSTGTGTKWMDNKNTEFTQSTVNRSFNEIGSNSVWYDVSELGGQSIQCKAGDKILVMAWARWDHNAANQVKFRIRRGPSTSAVTVGEEMTIEENDTGSSWDDEITTNFQWVDTIPSNGSYYYNFQVRAVDSWGTIYSSNLVLINLGQ